MIMSYGYEIPLRLFLCSSCVLVLIINCLYWLLYSIMLRYIIRGRFRFQVLVYVSYLYHALSS
jgi:hypothetical protein